MLNFYTPQRQKKENLSFSKHLQTLMLNFQNRLKIHAHKLKERIFNAQNWVHNIVYWKLVEFKITKKDPTFKDKKKKEEIDKLDWPISAFTNLF